MLGIGLYGLNGHQIHGRLHNHPRAKLVAVAAFQAATCARLREKGLSFATHDSLDDLLGNALVDLVVLCSPRRSDQHFQILRCLATGRHVYAEKPCTLKESEIDEVMAAAKASGRRFHEMAGTAFEQPWLAMRGLMAAGVIGDVVQVNAQKSYPWHDRRPDDSSIDGGLVAQVGVHAMRFVEHVAGIPTTSIEALQTCFGHPGPSQGSPMAAGAVARLANGGLATLTLNYLNPKGFGSWGNESLRIFGTRGMLEAVDGGQRTRLVIGDEDRGPITVTEPGIDWFESIVEEILDGKPMPITLEEELHPTRMILRAAESARHNEITADTCPLCPATTKPQ